KPDHDLLIGSFPSLPADGFGISGDVDEVRVWSRALSASEVLQRSQGVEPGNQPPTADLSATPSVVISPDNLTATVTLDGSHSSDPDHDPLQYSWTVDGQPAGS